MTTTTTTKVALERIGRPTEFWATRYEGGWSVYGHRSGLIVADVDRAEAERWLGAYEAARTWDHGIADYQASTSGWDLAARDASLGVGHIWTATGCPAYRTLQADDCTCTTTKGRC